MIEAGVKPQKKFSDYFKENIYVNPSGMLYGEQLRYCLETFGVDHILWGKIILTVKRKISEHFWKNLTFRMRIAKK